MKFIKSIYSSLSGMCGFSKGVLKIGFFVMLGFYISMIMLLMTAQGNWGTASAVYISKSCWEAAPASFVAAFAAAAICDIGTKQIKQKQK